MSSEHTQSNIGQARHSIQTEQQNKKQQDKIHKSIKVFPHLKLQTDMESDNTQLGIMFTNLIDL